MGEFANLNPGGIEGFIDMLTENPFISREEQITKFLAENVPDKNQLSIPSEGFDQRGNTQSGGPRGGFGLMSDSEQRNIGADLVLQNLLNQLNGGIPAERYEYVEGIPRLGSFSLPGHDIQRFFKQLDNDAGGFVDRADLPQNDANDLSKFFESDL